MTDACLSFIIHFYKSSIKNSTYVKVTETTNLYTFITFKKDNIIFTANRQII